MRYLLSAILLLCVAHTATGQVVQEMLRYEPGYLDYSYDPGRQIHRPVCVTKDHGFLVIGAPTDTTNSFKISLGTGEERVVTAFDSIGKPKFILRGSPTARPWNQSRFSYALSDVVASGSSYWLAGEQDTGAIIFGSANTPFVSSRRSAIFVQIDSLGRTLSFLKSNDENGVARMRALAAGANGDVIAMGEFIGTLRIGDRILAPVGYQNLYFMRVGQDGKIKDLKVIGHGDSISVSDVKLHPNGSIYALGTSLNSFYSTLDTVTTGEHGFCLKLSQDGTLFDHATSDGSPRAFTIRQDQTLALVTHGNGGLWREQALPEYQQDPALGYVLIIDAGLNLQEAHQFPTYGLVDSTNGLPYFRDIAENAASEIVVAMDIPHQYSDGTHIYQTLGHCGTRGVNSVRNDCFLRSGKFTYIVGEGRILLYDPAARSRLPIEFPDSLYRCAASKNGIPFSVNSDLASDTLQLWGKYPAESSLHQEWRLLSTVNASSGKFTDADIHTDGRWPMYVTTKSGSHRSCNDTIEMQPYRIETNKSFSARCIDSLLITPEYFVDEPFTVLWSNGDTTRTLVAREGRIYSVTARSSGCVITSPWISVRLDTLPAPPKLRVSNDTLYAEHPGNITSYTWYNETGTSITTSVNHLVSPALGTYSVIVTDNELCASPLSDSIRYDPSLTVGDTPRLSTMHAYPSQFSDCFEFRSEATGTLELLTMTGALVHSESVVAGPNTICPDIANGSYLLYLRSDEWIYQQRMIKQ